MAVSKKQQACVHRYMVKNYDRLELSVYKGGREIIRQAATLRGMSVNAYVAAAVDRALKEDGLALPEAPANENEPE